MRTLTIKHGKKHDLGIVTGKGVVNVTEECFRIEASKANGVPASVEQLLQGGQEALAALQNLAGRIERNEYVPLRFLEEGSFAYGPCVPEPRKLICVGLNYRKHAEESKMPLPEVPLLFNKFSNAISAHLSDIALPTNSNQVDYEAELAIVIGRKAKDVSEEDALHYVYGYCTANDLSARDLQMKTSQWLIGKTCDGFCPLGPYLVSADEVGDPNRLFIRSYVNGEIRQRSNTSDMVFYCDVLVSYISHHMTLEPGDVILTGTPEGVIFGYPKEKQVWLKQDDEVVIEIERLGALRNRIV